MPESLSPAPSRAIIASLTPGFRRRAARPAMTNEDNTSPMRRGGVEARILGWLVPLMAWLGWSFLRAGRQPARARIERPEGLGAPSIRALARSRRRRSGADIASHQGEETGEECPIGGSVLWLGLALAMRDSVGRRPKDGRHEVCAERARVPGQGRGGVGPKRRQFRGPRVARIRSARRSLVGPDAG
jgi:hypothetical protein